jgi:hypothetical protein
LAARKVGGSASLIPPWCLCNSFSIEQNIDGWILFAVRGRVVGSTSKPVILMLDASYHF